jgi:hypothetical protein
MRRIREGPMTRLVHVRRWQILGPSSQPSAFFSPTRHNEGVGEGFPSAGWFSIRSARIALLNSAIQSFKCFVALTATFRPPAPCGRLSRKREVLSFHNPTPHNTQKQGDNQSFGTSNAFFSTEMPVLPRSASSIHQN